MVRALVAAGAEVDKTNHVGMTPLHTAAREGREEVVRALTETG